MSRRCPEGLGSFKSPPPQGSCNKGLALCWRLLNDSGHVKPQAPILRLRVLCSRFGLCCGLDCVPQNLEALAPSVMEMSLRGG